MRVRMRVLSRGMTGTVVALAIAASVLAACGNNDNGGAITPSRSPSTTAVTPSTTAP